MTYQTLRSLIAEINQLEPTYTIFAREPFTGDSDAVVYDTAPSYTYPQEVIDSGLSYFLEVELAKDLIDGLLGPDADLDTRVARVIHYAIHDA